MSIEARFGPGGSVLFNADAANSFTTGTQDQNAIAANASGTVFVAWQDAGSGNPNSTDTDTRIEAQAFKVQPLPQPNFNGDLHSDILWQSSNGQASVWEMNGNTLIGGGAVSPNPGPAWKAIGAGDFNDDGHSDILWQNTSSGQATIWDMNGNSLVGGGPVSPNPGPTWKAIGTGDFNKRRPFRHPVAEYEQRPSLDLGNERKHLDRRRAGQPQSRADLESDRYRRFQ